MSEPLHRDAPDEGARDAVTDEIVRLLGLLRRLEYENASLRRELTAVRPLAA
jgi:hypothetical protein